MSDLSLETRASSAYIQGKLEALIEEHILCECNGWTGGLRPLIAEWRQAEAELRALRMRDISNRGLVGHAGLANMYAPKDKEVE